MVCDHLPVILSAGNCHSKAPAIVILSEAKNLESTHRLLSLSMSKLWYTFLRSVYQACIISTKHVSNKYQPPINRLSHSGLS